MTPEAKSIIIKECINEMAQEVMAKVTTRDVTFQVPPSDKVDPVRYIVTISYDQNWADNKNA